MVPTRLWWDGHIGRGLAAHDGVTVELRSAPELPGTGRITHLDYIPHVAGLVRVGCEREEEMTPLQRRQCSCLLRRVAAMARGTLAQPIGDDLVDEL